MIKLILQETYTKRDISGNVYHVVKIINTKNKKSFTTSTPSIGNVENIIRLGLNYDYSNLYITSICTDSTRISSLPGHLNLNSCNFSKEWKKELNKIGIRIKN